MPELPDLQVFSRNLNKKLAGKTLKTISVYKVSKLNISQQDIKKQLEGEKLEEIYREGKELRFRFKNGHKLGMHLMLNGKLFLFEKENKQKNMVAELVFNDDTGLVLADFQGLATLTFDPVEGEAPDALGKGLKATYLEEKLQTTRTAIKNLLMDQHIIRGIGNAYADEILWHARLSPFSVCNKIPKHKIEELTSSIKTVLKEAEEQILTSHPDLIHGEIRDFLKIHNPKRKESPAGTRIEVQSLNSRKTYFTAEQELFN
ncbi:Fpg/Nei family DNA glycosylase [Rubrolithibacter danxiaensis]|uniref:Fpg/Nei family DNA glycosylase n=1 Tax=Rubrolithibacter danxiaensis TaxID=3390805 RepID=UPI003BF7A257